MCIRDSYTALSGLKRLAVFTVHGSETDMDHRSFRFYITGLLRHTEYLLKVKLLALIGDVYIFDRLEILLTLDDGSQVRGGIQCSPVRLADNTRRQLLRVRRFGDIYDQGALALVCKTLVLQILDQPWDVLLSICLLYTSRCV